VQREVSYIVKNSSPCNCNWLWSSVENVKCEIKSEISISNSEKEVQKSCSCTAKDKITERTYTLYIRRDMNVEILCHVENDGLLISEERLLVFYWLFEVKL
jgi:hypothetical protein